MVDVTALGARVASSAVAPLVRRLFVRDGPRAGLVDRPVRISALVSFRSEKRSVTPRDVDKVAAELVRRALAAAGPANGPSTPPRATAVEDATGPHPRPARRDHRRGLRGRRTRTGPLRPRAAYERAAVPVRPGRGRPAAVRAAAAHRLAAHPELPHPALHLHRPPADRPDPATGPAGPSRRRTPGTPAVPVGRGRRLRGAVRGPHRRPVRHAHHLRAGRRDP